LSKTATIVKEKSKLDKKERKVWKRKKDKGGKEEEGQ
jgi:hypothetical protein